MKHTQAMGLLFALFEELVALSLLGVTLAVWSHVVGSWAGLGLPVYLAWRVSVWLKLTQQKGTDV